MAIIVHYIKDYAVWVYGACALIALWYLRVAIIARRERRYAMFSLERETALNKTYNAWTAAIILLTIIGLTYFLSTVVSEAVQPLVEEVQTPTPQPSAVVARPTINLTLPLPEITPTETSTARPRSTLRPQPTVLLTTATPTVQLPHCPDGRAIITAPGLNALISGMTPFYGTANHEHFKYYKLEYGAGANPTVWSYFAGGEKPIFGGLLGYLNATALQPGTYTIRIVVVDTTGNFPPPCQTVVVVR
jgi:hypothetical protein